MTQYNFAPNAARSYQSFRSLGYNNYDAILDLFDNSVDAGAKNIIAICRQRHGDHEIIIADDGKGMDSIILLQAVKMGSETSHSDSDLGKFGMGLFTAPISIARELIILSKIQNGKVMKMVVDGDNVIKANDWICEMTDGSPSDIGAFDEFTNNSKSGTVLILRKCDGLKCHNTTNFHDTLVSKVNRAYRHLIGENLNISINGKKCKSFDPLYLEDPNTQQYSTLSPLKNFPDINYRISITPAGTGGARSHGFSINRNNREIIFGETLGLFKQHNDLWRMVIELFFTSKDDKEFSPNIAKSSVEISPSLRNCLEKEIHPLIKAIAAKMKDENTRNTLKNPDRLKQFNKIANKINNTKHLIGPTVESPQGERAPGNKSGKQSGSGGGHTNTKRDKIVNGKIVSTVKTEFILVQMSPVAPIFTSVMDTKDKITIRINSDHPWYQAAFPEGINSIENDCILQLIGSMCLVYWKEDDDSKYCLDEFLSSLSRNCSNVIEENK